jgi:hypothetical protein
MHRKTSLSFATIASLAALAACHGGGSGGSSSTPLNTNGNNNNSSSTAPGSVSVTDAASDQITTFEVNVTAIDLTRMDGAVVHALPQTTRVDFAELVNESQLLSAFSLLAGTYKNVAITFDLSASANPQVVIAGNSSPATLLDSSGNPITGTVTETLKFPNANPLIVLPGLHNDIAIDFDLDASCTIDSTANTVTLGTMLQATQNSVAPKFNRAYGTLSSTPANQSFTITLNSPLSLVPGPTVTIDTTSATLFFVDGKVGDFSALAAKPTGTAILAAGTWSGATFTAFGVEAWTPLDAVEGHVLSRDSAGNLTVIGRGEVVGSGSAMFNTQFTVNATTTKVYQRPIPAATAPAGTALDQTAIAVGQRIMARGKLSGTSLDATVASGHVSLEETGIFGYANATPTGSVLVMNVARIGRRPIGDFNFTVGATAIADPANYLVNTSTMNVGSIAAGAPLAVRGIMTPITTPSGQPNANALTVVDRSNAASFLTVGWPLGSASPFASATSSEIDLDLTNTGRAIVDQGFISPVTFAKTDVPKLVALNGAAAPLYAIAQSGSLTVYTDFGSFEADLASRIAGGGKLRMICAVGKYDAPSKTLSAARVGAFVQ